MLVQHACAVQLPVTDAVSAATRLNLALFTIVPSVPSSSPILLSPYSSRVLVYRSTFFFLTVASTLCLLGRPMLASVTCTLFQKYLLQHGELSLTIDLSFLTTNATLSPKTCPKLPIHRRHRNANQLVLRLSGSKYTRSMLESY